MLRTQLVGVMNQGIKAICNGYKATNMEEIPRKGIMKHLLIIDNSNIWAGSAQTQ